MAVVILSALFAFSGHMRALASGYTDEAAFARALGIFIASLVVLRAATVLFGAWRARRRARAAGRDPSVPSSTLPPYPPRRVYVRADRGTSGDRYRAA